MSTLPSVDSKVFQEIRNAVLDLQGSETQTFERPLKRLSQALRAPQLEGLNAALAAAVDLDAFLAESEQTGGSFVGSKRLIWLMEAEKDLGLTLLLIHRMASDSGFALNFCHTYCYSGPRIIDGIRTFVRQILIPFERDYRAYVEERTKPAAVSTPPAKKEWSPGWNWVMGIVAALIIMGVGGAASWMMSKPELSKEERSAVFALVNDMRDTPIFLTMFYQQKHAFIDERWLKFDPKDTFFATPEMELSLFDVAHRLGRHRDALGLLSSARGQVAGTVKDVDRIADGTGIRHTVTFQATGVAAQSADLDLPNIRVLSPKPQFLPQRLSSHLRDLDLPGPMRAGLQELVGRSVNAVSFKKVTESSVDYLLVSEESLATEAGPVRFVPETALYVQGSLQDFLAASMKLTDAIDQWAERYSVELGTMSREAFDEQYGGGPGREQR